MFKNANFILKATQNNLRLTDMQTPIFRFNDPKLNFSPIQLRKSITKVSPQKPLDFHFFFSFSSLKQMKIIQMSELNFDLFYKKNSLIFFLISLKNVWLLMTFPEQIKF
ncbi:hypothetical protein ACKWTF_006771 [Chironomus riparius]